jgi:hypothetical protein
MKFSVTLLLLLIAFSATAQRKITPTDSFKILGKVKKERVYSIAQIDSFPKTAVKDQIIYNHKGEIKDTIKDIKGVLLTTLLEKTEFIYDKPKDLSEFYFVCVASDGYKVVFSWNELYNTEIGKSVYLITEMDGKKLKGLEQRILLFSVSDFKSGRRYVKSLERIEVKRAE